jgi:predicted ATPase
VAIFERELGVSPLPETRTAYEATLQPGASPPPTFPSAQWTVLPSLELSLIGREAALVELNQAGERLPSGRVFWISGEAGIGKSRLMQEFASQSQALVLAGSAYTSTQSVPYAPLLAALRPVITHPEWLTQVSEHWLIEAQVLLPELRTTFSHLSQPIPLEPSQAHGRQLEVLTQIFLGIAKQTRLWLCLDDMHWADEETLAWLGYFINRLPGSGLIVVATGRPSEAQQIVSALTQMRRSGLLVEITLDALDLDAVEGLLNSMPTPIQSPELAERLLHASGGNPFFLLEILRSLLERGKIEQAPENLPLPPSVREVISTRLDLVSPLAVQVLEAAVILETNLQPAIPQSVSGRQEDEIVDGLTELVDHQLLRAEGKGLEFHHDLIRMTVLERLHFWRQQALHRRAAEALSGHPSTHPTLVAHHWEQAEEWAEAARAYGQACQYFADQYAYRSALDQVERGLAILNQIPASKSLRLDLLALRMQLNQVLLRMDEWQADFEVVDELAAVLGNSEVQLQMLESKLSLLTL